MSALRLQQMLVGPRRVKHLLMRQVGLLGLHGEGIELSSGEIGRLHTQSGIGLLGVVRHQFQLFVQVGGELLLLNFADLVMSVQVVLMTRALFETLNGSLSFDFGRQGLLDPRAHLLIRPSLHEGEGLVGGHTIYGLLSN